MRAKTRPYPSMPVLGSIWFSLLIVILASGLVLPSGPMENSTVAWAPVAVHVLVVAVVLGSVGARGSQIILCAFLLRVAVLYWDLQYRHIFTLPHSGLDSEIFWNAGLGVVAGEYSGSGLYPRVIASLVAVGGESRPLVQYVNVVVGLSVVLIVIEISKILDLEPRMQRSITLLASFFPMSVLMSAVMLREIIPTFFVTSALYFTFRWIQGGKMGNVVGAMSSVLLASAFHTAILPLAAGPAFLFLFFDRNSGSLRLTLRRGLIGLVSVALFAGGVLILSEFVLSKTGGFQDLEDIMDAANTRLGNSAYLTTLEITRPTDILLYGPVKAVYLLLAPMPWDWRGPGDVVSFLVDSILYVAAIRAAVGLRRLPGPTRHVAAALAIGLAAAAFMFGLGVGNAGTAARHRHKLFSFALFLVALTWKRRDGDQPRLLKKGMVR